MLLFLSFLIHLIGFALLSILSYIDLRTRLLPNVFVFSFAVCALAFHAVTLCAYLAPLHIIAGAAVCGGLLYLVRAAANAYYQQDALGLGDVKLMAAAGLWLGVDGGLFALTLGAFAGLLHGIAYGLWQSFKTKERPNFHRLAIPAGPGFAIGIILIALWQYRPFYLEVLHGFGA